MPFTLITGEEKKFSSPQEMYQDYKNKKIENLYSYQSEIINSYLENIREKDISLELPTGSGKTLVGLLIGEYRRRNFNEKVLYVCPNRQLVNQTASQSNEEYGINAIPFTYSHRNYSQEDKLAYETGEAIAVTNYSSLFNSNPYFIDADLIIFDDAHSAEDFILNNWTLKISRQDDKILYQRLIDLFKDCLTSNHYEKCINENYKSTVYDIDKVPNIKALNLLESLTSFIDGYIEDKENNDIKFSWSMIKGNLKACNIFVSPKGINIRPVFAPTLTFDPFTNAKQRIYMSATLGESGELEKAFGLPEIFRLPSLKDWKHKSIGRRFFMFPSAKFKNPELTEFFLSINNIVERSLLIVSDTQKQNYFVDFFKEHTNKDIYKPKDIELSKSEFIENDNAIAIVANRFDGIDFPHDECRLEILYDLQKATNMQDSFLIYRMGSNTLFNEKIRIRLIQALGRCTRASTDYAVICVFGNDVMNSLLNPKQKIYFNPELQAELNFGLTNAKNAENIYDYINLMDVFLNDRDEWSKSPEKNIFENRDKIINSNVDIPTKHLEQLKDSSKYEVEAFYSLWQEYFTGALEKIKSISKELKEDSLRGYLGFWYYIAAYCSYNIYNSGDISYKQLYLNYLTKASSTTYSITWLNELKHLKQESTLPYENEFLDNIERLERRIAEYTTLNSNTNINTMLDKLISDLKSNDGNVFEKAYEELGLWFGFNVYDSRSTGSPDPNWIINQKLCITCESKIHKDENKKIDLTRLRQSITHKTWVDNHYLDLNLLKDSYKCITVYLSNSTTIDEDVKAFAGDIKYLNRDVLVEWAEPGINTIKTLASLFNETGDIVWREKANVVLKQNNITPNDFINLFIDTNLSDI